MWEVEYTDEFGEWWDTLNSDQQDALDDRVMLLAQVGSSLKRPVVGEITSSRHANMKELHVRKPAPMPSTHKYKDLHDRVAARPGASERLAALRQETLAEIGLYELRRSLERSQTDLAAALGISQPAVSQLERGEDVKLSTLRSYLASLGARLQVFAVFDDGENETAVPIRIGAGTDPTGERAV